MKKIIYIALITILLFGCTRQEKKKYRTYTGTAFGTIFAMTYEWDKDLKSEIDSLILFFNKSLNNYDESSNISKLNYNKTTKVDDLFEEVYYITLDSYNNTDGAIDITIAPIVNAWGFGWVKNERNQIPDSLEILDLLQLVGMDKIRIENGELIKSDSNIMIIGNAVAKGLSVDFISDYLIETGLTNYIIEIGGEIVSKGINPSGAVWKIGIDKPIEDFFNSKRENQLIISISDKGIATSGNYRQYIKEEGKTLGHSIDPRTGYPAMNELLSVTVISDKCAVSDAYATGFMVSGLEKSMDIANKIEGLEACFIYNDEDNKSKIKYTDGFKKYIISEED